MKKGRLSKELKNELTNNDIFSNVFEASMSLMEEDAELPIELSDETAPPE